jgi:hypothetical protein
MQEVLRACPAFLVNFKTKPANLRVKRALQIRKVKKQIRPNATPVVQVKSRTKAVPNVLNVTPVKQALETMVSVVYVPLGNTVIPAWAQLHVLLAQPDGLPRQEVLNANRVKRVFLVMLSVMIAKIAVLGNTVPVKWPMLPRVLDAQLASAKVIQAKLPVFHVVRGNLMTMLVQRHANYVEIRLTTVKKKEIRLA